MQQLFNKILVPVDFSAASTRSVEKAAAIALQCNCSIHLLHVVPVLPPGSIASAEGYFFIPAFLDDNKHIERRFERLINRIKGRIDKNISIEYSIQNGLWNDVVIDAVNQHHFDIVLIGQSADNSSKRKMIVDPDKIAAKTNVPVITVPGNRRLTRLYSIAIPVTDFLPLRKIKYGIYLASMYNTTIKLLGIQNEKTADTLEHYMNKADQFIRASKIENIESVILKNDNVADAVNNFSARHLADLVILNPVKQTKLPGFWSSLTNRTIQKYTAWPVLTVNPV